VVLDCTSEEAFGLQPGTRKMLVNDFLRMMLDTLLAMCIKA
jgi:hypothetical protein